MKIRRFVAKDMRTALAQIKEELGAEAVIMSNKKIPEGVELMAAVDYSQAVPQAQESSIVEPSAPTDNAMMQNGMREDRVSLSSQHSNLSAPQHSPQNTSEQVGVHTSTQEADQANSAPADSLSALLSRQVQNQKDNHNVAQESSQVSIEQQLKSFTDRLQQSTPDGHIPMPTNEMVNSPELEHPAEQFATEQSVVNHSQVESPLGVENSQVSQQDFQKMQQEMTSIRALLEHQVSGLMWQDMAQKDPQRAVLMNRLQALGLNEQISDQIAGYVPEQAHENQAWQQATQLIAQQINTTQNDIIHRGGVVALVGPTGVGKTTTIAKLAAGFAQVHGSDQVALISTDTFRIAGFEQLATYGKIIGCQVKLAKDSQELDMLLQQLAKKKLILIDTAGMGQRDMRLAEQLTALVSNTRVRIRNYLVLAANSQLQVMQENVDRFRKVPLSGCIYTKLDESVSIGEIITTSIQNGLPIGYLTDGQRVPEDIKVANAEKLVTLADKMATKSAKAHVAPARTMPVAPAAI